MVTCKNCANVFTGKYCNQCGQSANVKRFSFGYFLKESFFSSLDIENGFFTTLWVLLVRPGRAIREYLEGRRVSLYVPAKFLVLFGAIATFLAVRYQLFTQGEYSASLPGLSAYLQSFFNYAEENTTVINLISIPAFALSTFLVFRRKGYNYTEHLILNIYITAMQLVMLIVFFPLLEFAPSLHREIILCYTAITILYNAWAYIRFFEIRKPKQLLQLLLVLLLAYLGQFVLNLVLYSLMVKIGVLHPDAFVSPDIKLHF